MIDTTQPVYRPVILPNRYGTADVRAWNNRVRVFAYNERRAGQ